MSNYIRYRVSGGCYFFSTPIGTTRIENVAGLRNKNVSKEVSGHMKYKRNAHLFVEK